MLTKMSCITYSLLLSQSIEVQYRSWMRPGTLSYLVILREEVSIYDSHLKTHDGGILKQVRMEGLAGPRKQ